MKKYIQPDEKKDIEPIKNIISYKKLPRNIIFKNALKHVDKNLIADKYELYNSDYEMIKVVTATTNEIDQYIDTEVELRPIKIALYRHCYDNYTDITYYGIDNLKLYFVKCPFILDVASQEIFDCDRLDREWCIQNIDRIKIDVNEMKEIIIGKVNNKKGEMCV